MKTNKLVIGGIVGLGAYLLLQKPKPLTGLGVTSGLVSKSTSDEVIATIKRVARDLGSKILRASVLSGTPGWIINAISAHEIRFAPYNTINPVVKATGPMQMTLGTAFDTYYIAGRWGLLTPDMEQYTRNLMGADYPRFAKLVSQRKDDRSYQKYLNDTQFNLAIGALHLRCLIKLFTDGNGVLDMAKLALGYNQGISNAITKMKAPKYQNISPVGLIALARTKEAKAYIQDMVGTGGWFDLVRVHGV